MIREGRGRGRGHPESQGRSQSSRAGTQKAVLNEQRDVSSVGSRQQ